VTHDRSRYGDPTKESTDTSTDRVRCPKCGELIPNSETLHQQLREKAQEELRRDLAEERKAIAQREKNLRAKEEELRDSEEALERRVGERLEKEKARLIESALTKARDDVAVDIKALRETTAERREGEGIAGSGAHASQRTSRA
jgi:hypothetical protein